MKKGLPRLLLTGAALAGILAVGSGCASSGLYNERYYPRASSALQESGFSDQNINREISVKRINETEYVWIRLPAFTVNGTVADQNDYFPFGALKRDEMIELIDPETQTTDYSYENDTFIAFERDPQIRRLTTGLRAVPQQMPRNRDTANLREPTFKVKVMNFNKPGLTSVAYVESPEGLVLAPNPRYGVHHGKGNALQIYPNRGDAFVATTGEFLVPFDYQAPLMREQDLQVEVEYHLREVLIHRGNEIDIHEVPNQNAR
ncbi:hypothetical protein ACFL0X_00195 [Nanoarchaeota archaeon]